MKKILYTLCMLLSIATGLCAQPAAWLTGKWKGTCYQPFATAGVNWSVVITYKGKKLKVNYPTLKCGGTWSFQSEEGHRAEFREHITTGKANCIEGNTVVVQLMDNNYCDVKFYRNEELLATARIQKTGLAQ